MRHGASKWGQRWLVVIHLTSVTAAANKSLIHRLIHRLSPPNSLKTMPSPNTHAVQQRSSASTQAGAPQLWPSVETKTYRDAQLFVCLVKLCALNCITEVPNNHPTWLSLRLYSQKFCHNQKKKIRVLLFGKAAVSRLKTTKPYDPWCVDEEDYGLLTACQQDARFNCKTLRGKSKHWHIHYIWA